MMKREHVLAEAHVLITAKRASEYGDAHEVHTRIAIIWSAILGYPLRSWQVALMMSALKLARLARAPQHEDSWVDAAAYAALGAELASVEAESAR
jgi:rhamnogalacturonyl hydrolase YesR